MFIEKAGLVCERAGKAGAQVSPALLIVVLEIMLFLVRMWRDCPNLFVSPEDAAERGGPIVRKRAGRLARRQLSLHNLDPAWGDTIVEAALAELRQSHSLEVAAVIAEAAA